MFSASVFKPDTVATFPANKFDVEFNYLHKLKTNFYKLSFSCTLPKPQSIVITWLEFKIIDGGSETIKRYQLFNLKEGENTITLQFQEYVCVCSLVVSGEKKDVIEEAIEKVDKGLLYKNLNKLIQEIDNYFKYIKKQVPIGRIIKRNFVIDEIFYVPLPNWYYYARLTYANNNFWNNDINIDLVDLGKPIFCTPVYDYTGKMIDITFNLWGNYTFCLIENHVGFSLPLAVGTSPITRQFLGVWKIYQTNLYQQLGFNDPDNSYNNPDIYYKIFQAEPIGEDLEERLISIGEALPHDVVLAFIDARKRLELQDA